MTPQDLLPGLFKDERQRMLSELRYQFSLASEIAEDIVGDTFLSATEFWAEKGVPQNPAAWLHTVAKNKTKNFLKKKAVFDKKLSQELKRLPSSEKTETDFLHHSIDESELAMIFTICNPIIPGESQVGLALHLLCGFGIQEIADAFFTTRHVIYKRLERAKEKLKVNRIEIRRPTSTEIADRLDKVLAVLYLMFSEGYHSSDNDNDSRENVSNEAMRLTNLLLSYPATNTSAVQALFAWMCFHASRFSSRNKRTDVLSCGDNHADELWDQELVDRGNYYFSLSSAGKPLSKFHIEAHIAWWHTQKGNTPQKWASVLHLYDRLLELEPSPIAAIKRVYAIDKVKGRTAAVTAAMNLPLTDSPYYHALLSFLYTDVDAHACPHYLSEVSDVSDFSRQQSAA